MRGYCNNPVICKNCGSKRGFPLRQLCRTCQVKEHNPNRQTAWTGGQLAMLRDAYSGDREHLLATRKRLMELTGYTRGTIDAQCRRMGLRMLVTRPYTPQEECFIRENAGEMSVRRIAGILGRGVPCLQKKINQLGLRSWYRTEGLSQKDFAELMGVQAGTVRKWIDRGHLRMYDGKISSVAAKEFLRGKPFLYSVRRVDDDWFKSVVFEATA